MASGKGLKLAEPRRMENILERRRSAFEAVLRLVEKLGKVSDADEIMNLCLVTLTERLGVQRVSLYLVAPETTRLAPCRSFGIAEGTALATVPLESGFARWLSEAGGPVHMDEYFAEGGEAAGEEEETMRSFVEAGLSRAIALAGRDELLGVLFYGGVAGETSGELDEECVEMIARFAAITIENVFLRQRAAASRLELERFAAVKREFIAQASDELRTPLTVLKSTLWSLEPEKVDEGVIVDMARDAMARLEGKVEYLLSLNDIDLDTTDFKLEPSEMSSIIDDVLREMLPELEEKQVHVDIDDRTRLRKVLVDPAKIAIAIRSVLDGAVGFVDRGGNIAIEMRISENPPVGEEGTAIEDLPTGGGGGARKRGRAARDASYVVICVKDDGMGIPASEIAALAAPFEMASGSSDSNVKKLGIGLSVSQKIVAGLGGEMFCRSDLGQGTRFSIWLPVGT